MTIRTGAARDALSPGATASCAQTLRRRFAKELVAGSGVAFVEAKLAERDERHTRMGDSRYAIEPNIKEGKGGLRDLHDALLDRQVSLSASTTIAELVGAAMLHAARGACASTRPSAFIWTVRFSCTFSPGGRKSG